MERTEHLRRRIAELGFDEVRYAAAAPAPAAGLRGWLKAGLHADMGWMERTADRRLDPGLVLPGVRSLIVLGVNYWDPGAAAAPGRPVIARYALHADYHDTIKPALVRAGRLLEELCGIGAGDYRYYVDAGPVLERGWAARAGAGFIGKNAMLISRSHGNWMLLSAILTRAELPPDPPLSVRAADPGPEGAEKTGLFCGRCTRCMDACPTRAFPEPGVVDARRCVSYQTIENRGAIPRELRPGVGMRVFGCDACLDACPWNRFARAGRRLLLSARDESSRLSLAGFLELTPERFTTLFRRTPVHRVKHAGFLRNACVAAGNSGDGSLVAPLVRLASGGSPLVRAHAVWAVFRLAGPGGAGALRDARLAETDPGVLEEYAHPGSAGT